MVDKVVANLGAGGASFAVDNDGTQDWPFSKIAWGALHTGYNIVDDVDGVRFPVKPIGPIGAVTDAHASITTGGTSQQLLAAATRRVMWIWNPVTETETLYVNFTSAAAIDNTSIPLDPGAMLVMQSPQFVSNEAINVIAATAGHKVGCKWA